MIEWLQSLSGGAASFVGSFTGAVVGLVALLRRRDRQIRLEEKRSVVTALHAELTGIDHTLSRNSEALENITRDYYLLPDPAQSVRVFPHMLPKIGVLDPTTIWNTVDAYLMMDQYSESLLVLGGTLSQKVLHRRLIEMPSNSAKHVVMLNKKTSEAIQQALSNLDGHLHRA